MGCSCDTALSGVYCQFCGIRTSDACERHNPQQNSSKAHALTHSLAHSLTQTVNGVQSDKFVYTSRFVRVILIGYSCQNPDADFSSGGVKSPCPLAACLSLHHWHSFFCASCVLLHGWCGPNLALALPFGAILCLRMVQQRRRPDKIRVESK